MELGVVAWWGMPVIPGLGRLTQEDQEFKASLGYFVTHCFNSIPTTTTYTLKKKKIELGKPVWFSLTLQSPDLSWRLSYPIWVAETKYLRLGNL
jgi:hypothetical protein